MSFSVTDFSLSWEILRSHVFLFKSSAHVPKFVNELIHASLCIWTSNRASIHPAAPHRSFYVTTQLVGAQLFFLFFFFWLVGGHTLALLSLLSYKNGSDMETPSHRTSLLRRKDEQSAIQPGLETNGGELKFLLQLYSCKRKRKSYFPDPPSFTLLRSPLTRFSTWNPITSVRRVHDGASLADWPPMER